MGKASCELADENRHSKNNSSFKFRVGYTSKRRCNWSQCNAKDTSPSDSTRPLLGNSEPDMTFISSG